MGRALVLRGAPGRPTLVSMTETPGLPLYAYERLAEDIAEEVRTGRLPVGARLPGERDLAAERGVSLGTARRAVALLRERGIVATRPSLGTFVIAKPAE